MRTRKPTLITISVKKIQQEPYISSEGRFLRSAFLQGVSDNPEDSFEIKTGLLSPEQLRCCELLQQHGSTVVEKPRDWNWQQNESWIDATIKAAMDRIGKRYRNPMDINMAVKFDSDFAQQVLVEINKCFPHVVQTSDLKHAFDNEPSDAMLLVALEGLLQDGFIQGKTLYESMTGRRELVAFANIQITPEGRKHLSSNSRAPGTTTIIQGDQFVNYGQAGAMGHESTGTINYQSQWASLEHEIDLSTVALELQRTIQQLHHAAASSEDYQRLQLMAEVKEQADKKNGGKVIEMLSAMGNKVLPVFAQCGAEVIVRLMQRHFNLNV